MRGPFLISILKELIPGSTGLPLPMILAREGLPLGLTVPMLKMF